MTKLLFSLLSVMIFFRPACAETITHPIANSSEDQWRIDEPVVNQPVTEYPHIVFRETLIYRHDLMQNRVS
jgi:hypothetical protein